MLNEIAWKIGGQQGEGIDSTGDIMSQVCNNLGYYVYGYRTFSSRIKGGYTSVKVRIATRPVSATVRNTELLVALDQESIDRSAPELTEQSCVLADASFAPVLPAGCLATLIPLPLLALARQIQGPLFRNTVALGASAVLMGLPLAAMKSYTAARFGKKEAKVVELNLRALDTGAQAANQYLQAHLGGTSPLSPLAAGDGKARLIISGNDAMALGAVAADCRLLAGYPITPAYEVMGNLVSIFPKVNGAVVQLEDEIASAAFCVGAGFTGARVITSTSGPGLSLMQENLGLAIMMETPMVIVDVQRTGPSTGMPTKHEQSDLLAMLHGTTGDAPRIVLAPGDPAEAFADTVAAFNLADRFQTPVILASDLSLGLWKQTAEEDRFALDGVIVDRGQLVSQEDLDADGTGGFQRYRLTPDGVSPRALPGQRCGQHMAAGTEHGARGNVNDDPGNRVSMMRKRAMKLSDLGMPGVIYDGPAQPELVLVATGSTCQPVLEAAAQLRVQGVPAGVARIRILAPFPAAELADILAPAHIALVAENNAGSQLAGLLRFYGLEGMLARTGNCVIHSLLKFDGEQFYPDEIARGAQVVRNQPSPVNGHGLAEPLVVGGQLLFPAPLSLV